MTRVGIRTGGSFAVLVVATSLLLAPQLEAQEQDSATAAQLPAEPSLTHPTALESYLERPGILLVERRHRLAPIELQDGAKMRLDAIVVHEPGMEHQRMMGVRVEIDAPGLTSEERVSYIDVHEIEELVRAIGYMTSATAAEASAQGTDQVEMGISTQDDLEVGVRLEGGVARPFFRTPSATFAVRRDALMNLRAALDRAREYMFSN